MKRTDIRGWSWQIIGSLTLEIVTCYRLPREIAISIGQHTYRLEW